jgi:transmembrane sensor
MEELLFPFFEGTLGQEEREKVEKWKGASDENRQLFADSLLVWKNIDQLRRMRKYDSGKAIHQVHSKIETRKKLSGFEILQKLAAVLILPLIITTIYLAIQKKSQPESLTAWHTLKTPAGMRSEFVLPDNTKVYLNSNTSLSYPITFKDNIRKVNITGQAYFEVAENKNVPFIVNTGKINIEVTGTEFQAANYPNEDLTEIVLIEGGLNLFQGDYNKTKRCIYKLQPGERAYLERGDIEMLIESVNVRKYVSWKNGILIFRDDPMPEVVRKLNRWFNVDIQLVGQEIKDYAYTATFENESLMQILDLLKISAPIDYTIKQREQKSDNTFSKMEIIIKQQ